MARTRLRARRVRRRTLRRPRRRNARRRLRRRGVSRRRGPPAIRNMGKHYSTRNTVYLDDMSNLAHTESAGITASYSSIGVRIFGVSDVGYCVFRPNVTFTDIPFSTKFAGIWGEYRLNRVVFKITPNAPALPPMQASLSSGAVATVSTSIYGWIHYAPEWYSRSGSAAFPATQSGVGAISDQPGYRRFPLWGKSNGGSYYIVARPGLTTDTTSATGISVVGGKPLRSPWMPMTANSEVHFAGTFMFELYAPHLGAGSIEASLVWGCQFQSFYYVSLRSNILQSEGP